MPERKRVILDRLHEEFQRWEGLLRSLHTAHASVAGGPGGASIKDVVAHLWAWQQRSLARLEAVQADREPAFPAWSATLTPDHHPHTDAINAWIRETYGDRPWTDVYADWRLGFLRFLELADSIPEADLLQPGRYAWLEGHPLALVLTASYEHHAEHREPWLHRAIADAGT
ncbi:MAG: ClbS/DfsB family four-helix bundle protein [Litorilinea sp.]